MTIIVYMELLTLFPHMLLFMDLKTKQYLVFYAQFFPFARVLFKL